MTSYTLAQLARHIGAEVHGDETYQIHRVATLARADKQAISFLANSKYSQQLAQTLAGAVILSPQALAHCPTHALVMNNPYVGFAKVAQLLDTTPNSAQGVAPSAVIDPTAKVAPTAHIGPNAIIAANVEIGEQAQIGAGCYIGEGAKIGAYTKLWANVTIYHQVVIGQHCLIQSGTVIGSDGFGYANESGKWLKIPQLGSVIIGDHVEIGASTTIDRGALDNTEIHDGVILDNQIQIAHNAIIGANTAIAGCTVVAGSTVIGKNCTIAGMVGISGHLKIADGTVFTGMTMVTKSIKEPGVYSSGVPAVPNKEWHKTNARVKKLEDMFKRIKALENTVAQLQSSEDDQN
jgi:UDP-3-O-[3-hydroxymyristoyl] glucosamine N-acyltransferase